jgi:hypothetical protein
MLACGRNPRFSFLDRPRYLFKVSCLLLGIIVESSLKSCIAECHFSWGCFFYMVVQIPGDVILRRVCDSPIPARDIPLHWSTSYISLLIPKDMLRYFY